MTIFPCCRCGVTPPGPKPGAPDPQGRPSMVLRHRCRADGRDYKVTFWGPDQDANADCVYRWNEANARDDPAWHAERWNICNALRSRRRREAEDHEQDSR